MDRLKGKKGMPEKLIYDGGAEECEQDTVLTEPWEFWDGKILMELPSGLAEMEEERKAAYFPYGNRPEIMMEDRGEDVRLTLQLLEKGKGNGDVYGTAMEVGRLVKETFPQYRKSVVHLAEEGGSGLPCGWFLLNMEDIGSEHMKAVFLPEDGRLLLLTVTYPKGECVKWHEVCGYIRRSVRVQKKTEGKV